MLKNKYHRRAQLLVALNRNTKRNRLMTTLVDSTVAPAWGTVNFSANPTIGDTVTINGVTVTIDAGMHKATLADTLAAFAAFVIAHPITGVASVAVNGNGLIVLSAAPANTAITLAVSSGVGSVSAATLQAQKVRRREPLSSVTVTP